MNTEKKADKKQFILDANVLISDPQSLFKFEENDVVLTMTLLEELDKIKDGRSHKMDAAKKDARMAIHNIKNIINGAGSDSLSEGVIIGQGLGLLRIVDDSDFGSESKLDSSVPDNKYINTALHLQRNDKSVETHFVTKDLNLEIKSRAAGVEFVEDYKNDHQIDDIAYLKSGFLVTEKDVLLIYGEKNELGCSQTPKGSVYDMKKSALDELQDTEITINTYIFEDHELGEEPEFVYKVIEAEEKICSLLAIPTKKLMGVDVYGIKPKSIYQALAIDALLDENIDIVELTGPAGSGKTLLALASAISQTKANIGSGIPILYDRIILTRNMTDMDEPIGFLPGTEEDKVAPWLNAFQDSFEVILKPVDTKGNTPDKLSDSESTSQSLGYLMQTANIQMKSLNFMRGRSVQNTFFVLDEAQNATPHQIKAIITRMGQGSKIVLLGNLAQIDATYIIPATSGLTHAVEKLKNYEGSSTMCLPGGERSRLSAVAEKLL